MARGEKDFAKIYSDLGAKFGSTVEEEEFLTSGSVILDTVISGGKGIPLGKLIEFTSDSGVGKTTALLHVAKAACARGKRVVYIDTESGVNESQLDGVGLRKYLNEGLFVVFVVSTFEDVEDIISNVIDDPDLIYIMLDSITSTIPGKLLEKDKKISDVEPGLHARMAALFYQKYKNIIKEHSVTMFFINQTRVKLDFRRGASIEAAGGSAQKFYMDIRLSLRVTKKLEQTVETADGPQSVPYGTECAVWALKNRYARPFIPLQMTILFGKGISNYAAYTSALFRLGFVKQGGGGYYTISLPGDEDVKVRGTPALNEWVRTNQVKVKEIINSNGGFFLVQERQV